MHGQVEKDPFRQCDDDDVQSTHCVQECEVTHAQLVSQLICVQLVLLD